MVEEKELVDQYLKSRSEIAFRQLYQQFNPSLYRLAIHMLNYNEAIGQDVMQEVWIVALKKIDKFEWRSSLKTWLTGILINIAKKHIVKDSYSTTTEEPFHSHSSDLYDIKKAIEELPEGYRQVVVLHDVEGYTHKEIGELLSINHGTSKSQLFNARKALRLYLSALRN